MIFDFKINDKFIITWLSLCAFLHNILMNGTNNVIISSLQKEFYLSSRETGVYVSVYDIGSLCSSIIISFLATRGSKPKCIAFGMVMLFVGCMINVLPHFIKPDHSYQTKYSNSSQIVSTDDIVELCNHSVSTQEHQAGQYFPRNYSTPLNEHTKAPSSSIFGFQIKYLLYIANIVNGLSSASMTSITFSYIENFAPSKKLSSLYESIYFVMGAFGVGVGFMITSWCLKIHTDVDRMKELPFWLNPSHPNWIGAWWIPFLTFGIVAFFMAIVIAFFPRKLDKKTENEKQNDLSRLNHDEKRNGNAPFDSLATDVGVVYTDSDIQDRDYEDGTILSAVKNAGSILSIDRVNHETNVPNSASMMSLKKESLLTKALFLFKKPAYILVIICTAIEGLLQNSFLAFAALFLEYEYRLASGSASLVIGILSMPPLIIGGLVSSLIVNKFKSDTRKCLKFIAIVLFVNIFIYAGFMIYCKEPNMVSIEESLNYDDIYTVADDCNCNKKMFKPVCLKGSNDTFFQSACLAGCFNFDQEKEIYTNCTQVPSTFSESKSSHFINGLCPTDSSCSLRLVVSYVCIFLLMLMNALTFLPFLKATIGCIDSEEMNSIGLGFKQFFMNAFGTIPGPIIFGSVIDSTCIYWHNDENDQSVCKLYSNKNFAFGFGALGVGFKAVCFILIVLSLRFVKKQPSSN